MGFDRLTTNGLNATPSRRLFQRALRSTNLSSHPKPFALGLSKACPSKIPNQAPSSQPHSP